MRPSAAEPASFLAQDCFGPKKRAGRFGKRPARLVCDSVSELRACPHIDEAPDEVVTGRARRVALACREEERRVLVEQIVDADDHRVFVEGIGGADVVIKYAGRLVAFIVSGADCGTGNTSPLTIAGAADIFHAAIVAGAPTHGPIVLRVAQGQQRLPARLGRVAAVQVVGPGLSGYVAAREQIVVDEIIRLV